MGLDAMGYKEVRVGGLCLDSGMIGHHHGSGEEGRGS